MESIANIEALRADVVLPHFEKNLPGGAQARMRKRCVHQPRPYSSVLERRVDVDAAKLLRVGRDVDGGLDVAKLQVADRASPDSASSTM